MSGFVFTITAIGFLVGLVGAGIRLSFFGGHRWMGLLVCIISLVAGVPMAKAVRTPAEVAEDARMERLIADGEDRERDAKEQASGDADYSDTLVISSAQQAVKRKLLDERSARFRDVHVVVQASGMKAVCGKVNSKNRAGGYAGYQHFISAGTESTTYLEEQVADFASAWNELCVR